MIGDRYLQVLDAGAAVLEHVRQIGRHVQHVLDVVALQGARIAAVRRIAEEQAGQNLDRCTGQRRMCGGRRRFAVRRVAAATARGVRVVWCRDAQRPAETPLLI